MRLKALVLSGMLLLFGASLVKAQYSMDELGFGASPGFTMTSNSFAAYNGPSLGLHFWYEHYPCGKAYAFQFEGGLSSAILGLRRPAGQAHRRQTWDG